MGLLKFEFELLKFKFKPTPQAWPVLFAHNIIKVVSNLINFFSQFPFENNWKDPLPIFWPSLINSYHSPKHCGGFACQLALVENAIIDEEIHLLDQETAALDNLEFDDDPEPEVEVVMLDQAEVVTFIEAEAMVNQLKANCPRLGVRPEAAVHLDRFARALQQVKGSKATKKKDSTLHQFFQKK